MIKAAFFDIDGTLFSHAQRKIPESAIQAIHLMQTNGIKAYIATGRHVLELADLDVKDLRFDGFVALNGTLMLDANRNVEMKIPFDQEAKERIVEMYYEQEYSFILVTMTDWYINQVSPATIQAANELHLNLPQYQPWHDQDLYGAVVFFPPEQDEEFASKMTDNVIVARWNDLGVDIAPVCEEQKQMHLEGKPYGLYLMGQKHGFRREEMIAFGDSQNDVTMLKYAGIGVAMGNAIEQAKQAADYVTDPIDENGIWNAAVHFGLIDNELLK